MEVLFSVIMPVYNAETYLKEAISSVLVQSFRCWELLVVDDCSSDHSAEIICQFVKKDSRIRYLKTDSPSGSPTVPRNIGIEHAQGRYIAFLDSDDVWLPDKLEKQLALFQDFDDMALCFSDYEKMAETGERNHRIIKAPAFVDYDKLLGGNVIGCLTAVYDTEKVGKMFFPRHAHEDYILWLSILKRGYVARNTGTVEALYRVRKHSVSSNKWKTLSWQWDIYMHVEGLGYWRSMYCFLHYAYKAFIKALK